MANTSAAKKDIRQNAKRRAINDAKRREMKANIKSALEAIKNGDAKAAELVQAAQKSIDKAASTNVIHANKAARLNSKLQKKLVTV
jgi:small subunit ribosomal protein S20